MKLKFKVTGMSCSVCAASVEKAAGRVAGVQNAGVSLSEEQLICFGTEQMDADAIRRAVSDAGFGAELVQGIKAPDKREKTRADREIFVRLIVSFLCFLPVFYLAMGEMFKIPVPEFCSRMESPLVNACLQALFTLPVLILNRVFYRRGAKAVLIGKPSMDTLVSLGSGAAVLYSAAQIVRHLIDRTYAIPTLCFESAAMILTLVTFGKFLEHRAQRKTSDALHALMDLAPERVRVLRDGKEVWCDPEELRQGELIVIRPGETIAADGVIFSGESALDTSTLTGESIPRDVRTGDRVLSGSINLQGALTVKIEKIPQESTLAQMIRFVEEAGVTKAPETRLADRISGVFVPIVTVIAVLAAVFWLVYGKDLGFSIAIGIAVLVVSCPCALGLATPVSITAALGNSARRGILIREAGAFDRLKKADTVVLDKTGTITEGKPRVQKVCAVNDENALLRTAISLEALSEHPLAKAVCAYALEVPRREVEAFAAVFGKGVRGTIGKQTALGGSEAFLRENGVDTSALAGFAEEEYRAGNTLLHFSLGETYLGFFAVADTVREQSADAIRALKEAGLCVYMLTGDRKLNSESLAKRVGIDRVLSEVLPQEKGAAIDALRAEGKRVIMVGDGVNDAPALICADLGVSLGSGTDIAVNSADVILLHNDLSDLPRLIRYAARVGRVIRQNLFWAFFYNTLAIPVAAGALYLPFGITLNPMIAAAAMSVSSIFVVTNALRLYRGKEF